MGKIVDPLDIPTLSRDRLVAAAAYLANVAREHCSLVEAVRPSDGYQLRQAIRDVDEQTHGPTADALDAAWAEAEVALPNPSSIELLYFTDVPETYVAAARDGEHRLALASAAGPTPAAALRALAAKLREAGR